MKHYLLMNQIEILNNIAYVTYEDFMLKINAKNLKYLLIQNECNSIHNPPKWFIDNNKEIYTLDTNNNKKRLVDIIMKKKVRKYIFENDNHFDFTSDNIVVKTKKFLNYLNKEFKIEEKINGVIKRTGRSAGVEKNPIYKIKVDNKDIFLMYCEVDTYTIIDKNTIEKIKKFNNKEVTWYLLKNGYIGGHVKIKNKKTIIYLHQHLMDHYGKGLTKGTNTVDHINTNKLDNRLDNLRLVNQSEQNKNRGKRKRQKSAKCSLPDFIKELPKYVQYINSKGGYFCIRNHPNYPNEYFQSSTKKEVSLQEKYQSTLDKLKEYNNKKIKTLDKSSNSNTGVKYISKTLIHSNDAFSFDIKIEGKRYTKKKSKIELKDFLQLVLATFPHIRKYLEKEWNVSFITSDNNINHLKQMLPKYFSMYQEKKRNKDEYFWIISYNKRANGKRISIKRTLANINSESVKSTINSINLKL